MKKLIMLLVAASVIFAGFTYYGKVADNGEDLRVVRGQIVVDGKGIPGAVVQVFLRGQNLETQKPLFEVSCDATGQFIRGRFRRMSLGSPGRGLSGQGCPCFVIRGTQ